MPIRDNFKSSNPHNPSSLVKVKQNIEDILRCRSDLSPFLVHLTRANKSDRTTAKGNLRSIIGLRGLLPGVALSPVDGAMSAAKFAVPQRELTEPQEWKYFAFISFTETPLQEIRRLFYIKNRKVNLEPYGLVFLKCRLVKSGVLGRKVLVERPAEAAPSELDPGKLVLTRMRVLEKPHLKSWLPLGVNT